MTLPDRVACCARPCGHTQHRRFLKPGAVEWVCQECWRRVPREDRKAYLNARALGADQLAPDVVWTWAACRQAAIDNFVL